MHEIVGQILSDIQTGRSAAGADDRTSAVQVQRHVEQDRRADRGNSKLFALNLMIIL